MIRKLDVENLTYAFPEVAFDNDYVIATYQAKVQTKNIEKLAMAIADEQTTGTWIKVGADSLEKTRRFGAKLVSLYEVPDIGYDYQSDEPPMYIILLAYPVENFSTSMSAVMTILFGNISGSGMIRLIDAAFPKKFIAQFQGPKFGVEGLRKVLGVPDRPLLNAMIKPNIGWTPDEGAELFYRACKGGVDIIKDDELMLADGPFCPLKDRVTKFMEKEKKVFEETGEHSLYAVNVSDSTEKVRDNAYRALDYSVNCLMVNTYTTGYNTLKMLAEDPNIHVPILAHVNFAGAMAASTYTGISAPLLIGKLTRLAGGVHGHPDGSEAGAKSMRQAIDAALAGIPVVEYAKDHAELARMLGFLNPDLRKNFDLMN